VSDQFERHIGIAEETIPRGHITAMPWKTTTSHIAPLSLLELRHH